MEQNWIEELSDQNKKVLTQIILEMTQMECQLCDHEGKDKEQDDNKS